VVVGGPQEDSGEIALPLGRLDASRGWWMKADENGQPALTTWRVMGRSTGAGAPLATNADDRGEVVCATRAPSPLEEERAGPSRGHAEDPCPAPGIRTAAGAQQLTWLALEPLTGRTHQLRVHCAAMGWPIVGDGIYGSAPRHGGPGLQLHAREVVVPLYKNRDPIRVTAPVPPHLRQRLAACGWSAASETSEAETAQ
jgi:tRNA pseudouridine32 synthase / 23S rRNA pseudouridine746 synthase